MTAKEFFPLLREKKSSHLTQLWEDYLIHLAFAIKNINMIVDAPIIISGYLAPFFTEEDIQILLKNVNSASPFPLDRPQILIGNHGQYTPAIGAALFYVDQFIRSVWTCLAFVHSHPHSLRCISINLFKRSKKNLIITDPMGCHQIGDGVIGINQLIMKAHNTDSI